MLDRAYKMEELKLPQLDPNPSGVKITWDAYSKKSFPFERMAWAHDIQAAETPRPRLSKPSLRHSNPTIAPKGSSLRTGGELDQHSLVLCFPVFFYAGSIYFLYIALKSLATKLNPCNLASLARWAQELKHSSQHNVLSLPPPLLSRSTLQPILLLTDISFSAGLVRT